jgi:hypothetical protein
VVMLLRFRYTPQAYFQVLSGGAGMGSAQVAFAFTITQR